MAPDRDLSKLHPLFRPKIEQLLTYMRQAGHDPYVFEAFRSFERAEALAKRGTGVARSMHCYGLAVDIISVSRFWSAPKEFWSSLEQGCDWLGLFWGGHFTHPDKPHVQAVPVRLQSWVRAATPAELDQIARSCLS